jgi:hypothetical protein
MRGGRTLVLVILAAALAGIAVTTAERLRGNGSSPNSQAAAPQTVDLGWRETYGSKGEQLVFGVGRFRVLANGWRADVWLDNDTSIGYELGDPQTTLDRAFGLMLFTTGSHAELAERNHNGTLPTIRPAGRYSPRLPEVLRSHSSWRGTISAPGALVARSWMRVVFGELVAIGKSPAGLVDQIVWITDHAYKLKSQSEGPR